MKRAVVIGSGGQVGRAVVAALKGWHVVGLTSKDLDREDAEALRRATAGADVVVDVIAFTAGHAEQLVTLDAGAIVAISSAAVYGELGSPMPVPVAEDHPRRGTSAYAHGKIEMEDVLLGQSRTPAAVLRPCAIHGPGSRTPREWYFFKRRLDGRTRVPLAFRGRSLFHTTAAANLAELVRCAAGRHGAYNAGDPDPPTVSEIARLFGLEPVPVEGDPPGSDTPWSVEHPLVLDMAKAGRELGYAPVTDYARSLPATVTWLREQGEFPGLGLYEQNLFDYAAEDRLMAGL